ncbi:B12-binding domain-containing radical SAM protein [Candidatus Poribacteria bacterium]|nr:B12-binding domain-containing radical SAM protein [Candidatus Poribacteria bacterium]
MAKVLFINPIVREEDVPRHIPYGMAILAEIARKNGHLVQVYDANAWRRSFDVLTQIYQADNWDLICIGGLTTSYGYIKRACQLAKSNSPSSVVLVGGGFFTSMPREIMEWVPEIDLGIIGEAYVTFQKVLEKIDSKKSGWSETLGVVFRNNSNEIIINKERPNISNLDIIPWPAWDLFPLEEVYFKNSSSLFSEEAYESKRRIDINGSYGCSLICKFCWHLGTTGDMVVRPNSDGQDDVVFTYGRNIRYHSPDYIIEMVLYLKNEYDIDHANFLDENLMTMDVSSRRTWLEEICEKWIENGLQPDCRKHNVPFNAIKNNGVFWSGTSHATLHTPEILDKMYKAGCTHLVYGLESFDPEILKNLGKGTTRKRNEESIATCLNSGIKPIPNIIIGFPEESFDSIRNTINSLINLGIHAKPHFATAYPGSEWFYDYKQSIIEQYDSDLEKYILDLGDATKITATISHRFSPMDLIGLQEIVARKDLRLLDLSEKNWIETRKSEQYLSPSTQVENFIGKNIKTPMGTVKVDEIISNRH